MSEWIKVEFIEEISVVGEEILTWDGCERGIDYVEVDAETGHHYMANSTELTHWARLLEPPTSD